MNQERTLDLCIEAAKVINSHIKILGPDNDTAAEAVISLGLWYLLKDLNIQAAENDD